ncbi:autophagy protein 5 [Mortierella polycephala]|uniref:Autophagy protein 5 n=1 Tax=Mortierella polycephala TaxID=41804 RepID=A0A9P6TVU8_9FUNG|nr:autophagy protein 5 [Mortierella polycephala]
MSEHIHDSADQLPFNPVARVIWDGSIPIHFILDKAESAGSEKEPLLIEAPRCSYLSRLTNQVCRHFQDRRLRSSNDDSEMWYEYEGVPLKWHYPIGLLYDIHGMQTAAQRGTTDSLLPWKVIVHFKDYPTNKLIKTSAPENSQDFFMSMIKEADYLRNGSTKKVMNMSKSDQSHLWEGLWSKNYDLFWSMNQKLVLNDGILARHLPIRIYLPDNCPVIQDLVCPMDEDDQPKTLRHILNAVLPDLFPLDDRNGSPVAEVIIHGIKPNMDMSVLWAAQNMAYPDNFLHLVIVVGGVQ